MPLVTTEVPLLITTGRAFSKSFIWKDADGVPVPLLGKKAKLQARDPGNLSKLYFTLSTEGGSDGTILLTDGEGKIDLFLSATVTKTLSWSTDPVYDLVIYETSSDPVSLLGGTVELSKGVTEIT